MAQRDFLEQLVENARSLISSSYYRTHGEVSRTVPSMSGTIRTSSTFPLIAEIKISSPSYGVLCDRCPEELADL